MKPLTVLVVPVEGPLRTETVSKKNLSAMQRLVGGYIEAISGSGWTAYCDEEGKLKGKEFNRRASALALALGWNFYPGDSLVGDVVFCGPGQDGYDTDVPEFVTKLATEAFRG